MDKGWLLKELGMAPGGGAGARCKALRPAGENAGLRMTVEELATAAGTHSLLWQEKAEEQDRDVVGAAAIQGCLDELRAGLGGRVGLHDG